MALVPPLPTESSMNNDLDLKNKKETNNQIFIYSLNGNLYNLEFSINKNDIEIKCNNTENGKDTIYIYNLTLEEIKKYGPYKSLSSFYNYLKTLNNKNYKIEEKEKENIISLSLLLDNHNSMVIDLSEYINPNDSIKRINNLERENKNLKNRINDLESNLSKFFVEFENYKNMMELNCFYNSFDLNAYKLEQLFSSLESNIMLNRKEFGLINKGIYQLFNKNITSLVLKYNSNNNILNPSDIQNIINNIKYFIVFIYTTDKKRFGAFLNNKNQNDMNNNNMNNHMNNNMINNNMGFQNFNRGLYNYAPMMNNQNLQQNNINIFSSQYLNHYFVFSLDALKIYYSNNEGSNIIPQFSILFDNNREVLYGKEGNYNYTQFLGNQLSGKSEFNIKYFEIYEVKF